MYNNASQTVKIIVTKTKLPAGKSTFRIEVVDGETIVYTDNANDIKTCDKKVWSLSEVYNIVDIEIYTTETPPTFKLSEIPSIPALDEEETSEYFESHQDFVYNRIIQAVEEGIITKRKQIRLFELNGLNTYITSDRENWISGLIEAIKYFEKVENYEQCHKAKNLQETLTKHGKKRKNG
jgi:hypothetical protein